MAKRRVDLRKNSRFWCFICVLFLLVIAFRFLHLQIFKHNFLDAKAKGQHERVSVLLSERGKIYDSKLKILAYDDFSYNLFIDPTLFYDHNFTITKIAEVFSMDKSEIENRIETRTLAYILPEKSAKELIALKETNSDYAGLSISPSELRETIVFNATSDKNSLTKDEIAKIEVICGFSNKEIEEIHTNFVKNRGDYKDGKVILSSEAPQGSLKQIDKNDIKGISGELYQGYRVVADKRLLRQLPKNSQKGALKRISDCIGITEERLNNIVFGDNRYIILKKNLTATEYAEYNKMQSTLFVTTAGLYYNSLTADKRSEKIDFAVRSIYSKVHGIKPGAISDNEKVSMETIRTAFLPSAAVGAVFTATSDKGTPMIAVQRAVPNLVDTDTSRGGITYGLAGVSLDKVPKRIYPYSDMAAPVLGWTREANGDVIGAFGIEYLNDELLHGKNGKEVKEVTIGKRTIPNLNDVKSYPINGTDIQLTIDTSIQQVAESALKKAVNTYNALGGQCVVLNSSTGELLALVNLPSWDANDPGNSNTAYINRSIHLPYEPGSIFKAFTVAIALEEGAISDGQVITNCTGHLQIGKHSIGESHNSHGSVTPSYLMEQSCNIGSAVLSMRVGADKFVDWCEKFGFGEKTGIELPNESSGQVSRKLAASKVSLANMGFGQGLTATGVQLAAAYGVFLNGGKWVQPHIIKATADEKGRWTPRKAPETREVCSKKTADLMLRYMERVVQKGTGKPAAVEGYRIGGKTGTAQKAVPGIGYASGRYYGSFVGVMPLDNSYNDGEHLVILVMLDDPRGGYYGGTVSAPAVGQIARGILPNLVTLAK